MTWLDELLLDILLPPEVRDWLPGKGPPAMEGKLFLNIYPDDMF